MSIKLAPSKNYPGRTALHHKTYPDSNMTTILDLTPEDVEALRQALAPKVPVAKIIALTLAELGNHKAPTITEWGQAKVLADKFESAGRLTEKEG